MAATRTVLLGIAVLTIVVMYGSLDLGTMAAEVIQSLRESDHGREIDMGDRDYG